MKKKNYLTKKMFMLAICIAMMLAISTGCKDEPTKPIPPKIPDCITVEPIAVEEVEAINPNLPINIDMAFLSVALGSYPNVSNPQMIVINSFEDVLQYKINPLSVLGDLILKNTL